MKIRLVPYKQFSKSAKILSEKLRDKLGYKVFRGMPRENRKNIFWGWCQDLSWNRDSDINNPDKISVARDKLRTFQALEDHCPIPEYTTSKETAEGWINKGKIVLARKAIGQGGSGIVVCGGDYSHDVPAADLYVQYIKKRKEFRVHVIDNQIVLVKEKRKARGVECNNIIRSHRRGWVHCSKDIEEPGDLREVARNAVKQLGLYLGAVDIIWNEKKNQCYVLEVNTAPGLCPTTAEAYADKITES
jgi:glutathione synthase/RimK-type ligase-like ATP-grasp enzyme